MKNSQYIQFIKSNLNYCCRLVTGKNNINYNRVSDIQSRMEVPLMTSKYFDIFGMVLQQEIKTHNTRYLDLHNFTIFVSLFVDFNTFFEFPIQHCTLNCLKLRKTRSTADATRVSYVNVLVRFLTTRWRRIDVKIRA